MMNNIHNPVKDKSYSFAVRIVGLYKMLSNTNKEYVISKQILRSGTSIAANIHEAIGGQSRKDFITKLQISYKETLETEFWIRLLRDTNYINEKEFISLNADLTEIIKLLVSILNSAKSK